jgi:hypothetical protein
MMIQRIRVPNPVVKIITRIGAIGTVLDDQHPSRRIEPLEFQRKYDTRRASPDYAHIERTIGNRI